jgi:outer membrane receptor protein involved in Fe transport
MGRLACSRDLSFGASVLALALAAPSVASAQSGPPASPPGVPESSAQDDDAGAAAATDVQPAAQDVAGPLETGSGENEIIVTGTRIARPEFSSPNPVQSFTSAGIEQSGETNLTDFLVDSPALVGSTSNAQSSGSNTGAQEVGLNLLNLRNLGTERTLVLVNGRRHVNAYPGENSVDVNTIPVDLIDRVDVLTGGASAIYGADAVSGVVNFVLKRDFEGLRSRGQSGISSRGDAGNRFGSIVAGKNFAGGRGNLAAAYEFNESDRFSETQRSYTGDPARRFELLRNPADSPDDPNVPDRVLFNNVGWADSAPNGAVDIDLDGVPDFDGDGRPYDGGTFLSGTGGRAINGSSNTPTAGYFGDVAPYLRRHNVNLLGSFELSPALRLYAEGKYVDTTAYTEIQPSFDFFTFLAPDNFYLQQRFGALAPDGALVSRDNFDFGRGAQFSERETLRGVLGVDGKLTAGEGSGNLKYDVSFVYGQAKSRTEDRNARVLDRYYAALDAVVDPRTGQVTCRINLPGETIIDPNNYAGIAEISGEPVSGQPLTFSPGQCRPISILGQGVSDPAGVDFVFIDDVTVARNRQYVASASLSGDLGFLISLPGGPIGFALGTEYRRESTSNISSEFAQLGAFEGGTQTPSAGGKYDVKEAFGEINVPLFRDAPFAQTLSFGGAVRYSDYSTIGSTLTYKVDGTYAPVRDLTFRGTYSQAVRAPNITELFNPEQGTFEFLDDPCDPLNIDEGSASRSANCLAQLQAAGLTAEQIANFSPSTDPEQSTSQTGVRSGNPNLNEETAKTWTAGAVLRPRFLPGLTLSADWYNIKIRDAINTPDANDIFKNCVDAPSLDNQFCQLFTRSSTTGFINSFRVTAQNVAEFTTSGLDVVFNYRVAPIRNIGAFNFRLVGGYLHDLTFIPSAGAEPDQDAGEIDPNSAPKYVGTADLTWTAGAFTVNYGLSWQSKVRRFVRETTRANPDAAASEFLFYKERWEHDLQVAFAANDDFSIYGGVNNFTDQKPAVAANFGYPVSTVGRFFYVGARANLGSLFGRR